MNREFKKQNVKDILALTPMQEGMLFHYLKSPGDEVYFEQLCLDVSGTIDPGNFEQAWNGVVDANDILRTVFRWEKINRPTQAILKEHRIDVLFHDLSTLTEEELIELQLEEIKRNDRKRGFDLREVPFRVALCKVDSERHWIIVSNHHILFDGWSTGIILEEFFHAYDRLSRGEQPLFSPTRTSFKEFVMWYRVQDHEEQKSFWKDYLEGFESRTELPAKAGRNLHGENVPVIDKAGVILGSGIKEKLTAFIKMRQVTMAAFFFCAWGVLLQKYCDADDVVFGTTVSGRSAPIKGIEKMVGLFINTVPLRLKKVKDGETAADLLDNVNLTLSAREPYENTPLVDIKSSCGLDSRQELFDSIMVIENYPLDSRLKSVDHALSIRSYSMHESSNYDLTVGVAILPDVVNIELVYLTGNNDRESVERLSGHFKRIIEEMVQNPYRGVHQIEILSQEEKKQLLEEFNDTEAAYPRDKTIHRLFEEQAGKSGDQCSVVSGRSRITYGELDRKAGALAALLQEKGVGPDTIVAIEAEGSIETIIGFLGILKAGGAYLPIDPAYPRDRIDFMLKDSNAALLLTSQDIVQGGQGLAGAMNCAPTTPTQLCYIIYTSGSTGRPRGVLVEHRSMVNACTWQADYYNISQSDRGTQYASLSFDAAVLEIFPYLIRGASVYVVAEDIKTDPEKLNCFFEENQITVSFLPTQLCEQFMELENRSLRVLLAAGDKLRKFIKRDYRLYNNYGPTENTVVTTSLRVNREYANIPIGKPVSNACVYILDSHDHLQPIGVPGELCVSGAGVARGYLNRPELTAARFVDFYRSQRTYKTGDLARWLPDGNIEFLGRIDRQVKIRGFRIELGEIAALLLKHENINEAAVTAREDAGGDKYLCAYIVKDRQDETSPAQLKEYLLQSLPGYMVPAQFVTLETMPLNQSGKVDTRSLPEPGITAAGEYIAPRDDTEKELVKIWADVLGVEETSIGIDSDFFEMGGHSLKVTRLVSLIHKMMNIRVPLPTVFDHPTIRELAQFLGREQKCDFKAIPRVEEGLDFYALSPAQERLFVLQQMDTAGTVYNINGAMELEGVLDREKFRDAFITLIHRHESLRTSFHTVEGRPVQKVHDTVDFSIEYTSLGLQHFFRPFDLSQPPLMRIGLAGMEGERHLLMIDMHHIISDGTSMGVFIKEFMALYNGETLPVPEVRYRDYVRWFNQRKKEGELKSAESYWLRKFEEDVPILNMPTDFARPAVQDFGGAQTGFNLDPEQTGAVRAFARETGATVYVVLISLFTILLSKLSGQEDVVVGTAVAGRTHEDLSQVMGMFVNTLALRNFPSGHKSVRDFVREVGTHAAEAFEYQEYPFEDLVERVSTSRDASRNPLFDTVFAMQNFAIPSIEIPGLNLKPWPYDSGVTKFDLTFFCLEKGTGLDFTVEYRTSIFREDTIERFIAFFKTIIAEGLRNKGQEIGGIEIISPGEKRLILEDFNDTGVACPPRKTLHRLFEEQVERYSDRCSVVGHRFQATYQELDQRASRVAHVLQEKGVGPDTIVALMVERSVDMIIGILGILKSGGAYLPIDPGYPQGRIDYMLKDSNAKMLLTNDDLAGAMNCAPTTSTHSLTHSPTQLCYIIYTSGSTGKPKGVLTTHANVVRVVKDTNYIEITERDRVLQLSNYAFDGSVFDIYGALVNGAALVLAGREKVMAVDRLAAWIKQQQVSVFFVTTALFNALVELWPDCFRDVRKVLFGGERVSVEHSRKALEYMGEGRILHVYGPTETTVYATYYPIDHISENAFTVPIGSPISNTVIYILDNDLHMVPVGVSGEVYIGGEGVARGYLNRPELIAERFVDFNRSHRTYKTGDLARWLPDGAVEFLGRIDHQVKIRGFRIEMGEIESRLLEHEFIKEALVTTRHVTGKELFLCAYIVPEGTLKVEELRDFLSDTLPDYMIPHHFTLLEKFPLNPNGKIDVKALPVPEITGGEGYEAPRDEMERALADIWSDVLEVDRNELSIDANFFEIGGHSLKATSLAHWIYKKLGKKLEITDVFTHPTIRGQARKLRGGKKSQYQSIAPVEEKAYYEISYAQRRLWVLCQFEEDSTAYNIPLAFIFTGNLDEGVFRRGVQELSRRHESLRTVFRMVDGDPCQVILPPGEYPLEVIDLRGWDNALKEEDARRIYRENANMVFDLENGPLFLFKLVRLEDDKYLVIYNIHHIISDGWSQGNIRNEIIQLYNYFSTEEGAYPLPEPELQYKDYSRWHNRLIAMNRFQRSREYWLEKFKDKPNGIELPLDHPRKAIQTFNGGRISFALDKRMIRELQEICLSGDATLFMGLLTLFNIFLYRYTGQQDIIIGAPIANRKQPELHPMVGFLVNTLVFRNRVDPVQPFESLLQATKKETLDCYNYQDFPFDLLVEGLDLDRDMSRSPIFNVMLAHNNTDTGDDQLAIKGVTIAPYAYSEDFNMSKFDLTFFIDEMDEQVFTRIEYNSDLFDRSTIQRMADNFVTLAGEIAAHSKRQVSSLNILEGNQRKQVVYEFNRTREPFPEPALQELFEEQGEKFSHQCSVFSDQSHITYGELNRRVNRLARFLLSGYNVKPNDIIGISMDRGIDMIVVIWGIIKSGAGYLAVDPTYPRERVLHVLDNSRAELLITDRMRPELYGGYTGEIIEVPVRWREIEKQSPENPPAVNQPGDVLYVNYTSGSTGTPNGAMLSHDCLTNLIRWQNRKTSINCSLRVLQFTSINFCVSFQEIIGTLTSGGQLYLIGDVERQDTAYLMDFLSRNRIQVLFLPYSYLNFLFTESNRWTGAFKHSFQHIITAGEQLKITSGFKQFLEESPHLQVHNHYGSTEMHVVTSYTLDASTAEQTPIPPAGKPISNVKIFILDEHLNPVPVGAWGELMVVGDIEILGYINNKELTDAKLVHHPVFSKESNIRLYRSGDIGRWLPDGNIELRGRKDFMVKIRGFRIELGEVESKILAVPQVCECVVVPLEDEKGQKNLFAYVSVDETGIDALGIKRAISNQLPMYMIPHIIILDSLPLMPNGKVDRGKLPEPDFMELSNRKVTKPTNEVEARLVDIWSQLLEREKENIGIDDNFFELGGHSLKATVMVSRIYKELGVEIPLADVFTYPTVRDLAAFAETAEESAFSEIPAAELREYYPLSFTQKRQYILQKMKAAGTAYNMPAAAPLHGKANLEHMETVFKQLIHRHESLRTSFHMIGDEPVQVVHDAIDFSIEKIGPIGPIGPIKETIAGFIRPFRLDRAPLIRVGVMAGEGRDIFIIDMHHIISDGTSLGVLTGEFMALYMEEKDTLPHLTLQYKDFAVWQNSRAYREMVNIQEEYWLTVFPDELPVLALPTDHPRPPVQRFDGDKIEFSMNEEITKQLNRLAIESNTTLFMVLLSIFSLLLWKLDGEDDIIIGVPVAGRRHADLAHIIGMFINTVALRSFPSGDKIFASFLHEVKAQALSAFENQDYPFEDLVDKLGVQRDTARNPIFDVMFNLLNQEEYSGDMSGFVEDNGDPVINTPAKVDLELRAAEQGGVLYLSLEYCTSLFEESTIRRFTQYFKKITAAVLANPEIKLENIEIIPDVVKKEKLAYFNEDLADPSVTLTLQEKLSRSFRDNSSRTAVEMGDRTISYGELDKRSGIIADCILARGIGKETPIGIFCEDRVEIIVIITGILKAGCAFSPLETTFPANRISTMIRTTAMPLVFTDNANEEKLAQENIETVTVSDSFFREYELQFKGKEVEFNGEDIIYIYFTSGSTGTPKAIAGKNHALLQFVQWQIETFGIPPSFRFSQLTAVGFDVYLRDVFTALCAGASICIPEDRTVMLERKRFIQWLDRGSVNLIHCVPSVFRVFNSPDLTAENFKGLRYILFAGEPTIPYELKGWYRTFGERIQLVNVYGATEVTLFKICHFISPEDVERERLPVGGPTMGGRFILLDKGMNVCDRGIVGEVYVRTPYLAAGYLNDPELTAERFIANPFGSDETDLIYKMGDLGREAADGHYELLGRMDGQVKLRGIRIELGDIESALLKHDAVEKAVVLLKKDDNGEKYLCAYIVPGQGGIEADAEEFRRYMKGFFPDYMIPAFFITVDRIPLTPNGKIDRKSLPQPEFNAGDRYVAPRSAVEEALVDIWSQVLNVERDAIGIDDNFFHLGGHSLRATVAITRIQKELAVEIPLVEFFTQPTIRGLARFTGTALESKHAAIEPAEKMEYYKLSSVQKRLYFIQQLDPSASGYNVTQVMELVGELDATRVEQVLRQLIHRHESLRTSFHMIGDLPVQMVHDDAAFEIDFYDLATKDTKGHEDIIQNSTFKIINSFLSPFDLSRAPLMRAALVRMGDTRHVLAVDMHHIITDGTSVGIFFREFNRLYSGETLPGMKLQYKDYAVWMGRKEQLERLRGQAEFWLETFVNDGEIPVLNLPVDHPRPAVRDFEGEFVFFNVEGNEAKALNALALEHGATPFMVLLSIYNVFLAKVCLQEDLVVGIPTAGRRHADLEPVVGMFINTLPLRNKPTGEKSFGEFLEEVNTGTVNAFANQDFHFEELVEKTGGRRDPSRNPLFDTMFVLQNMESPSISSPGLELRPVSYERDTAKFDLTLLCSEGTDMFIFALEYAKKLFIEETVQRFARYLKQIIADVTVNRDKRIAQISMLPEEEKQQLLFGFNNTEEAFPTGNTVYELFEKQVDTMLDHPALEFEDKIMTFRHFDERANQLANYLRMEKGLSTGDRVLVSMERSIELIIALMGVMKAGGAYVPLDPHLPAERLRIVLSDASIGIVISQRQFGEKFARLMEKCPNFHSIVFTDDPQNGIAGSPKERPGITGMENPAYVMYTSGSSGVPKGVLVEHRTIVNTLLWRRNFYDYSPGDVSLQIPPYFFDSSVTDIFTPLLGGARLVLVSEDQRVNLPMLKDVLPAKKVTHFIAVPAFYNVMIEEIADSLERVKKICCAGEHFPDELIRKHFEKLPHVGIVNEYGPTENSVNTTAYELKPGSPKALIGSPISNVQVTVRDRYMNLCPIGVGGEMCLSGASLARGYLNRPELTAEKFVDLYRSNRSYRSYKTGDMARWLPGGNLEFLGRLDNQVKIRGIRVEVEEIENHLMKRDDIKEAVVLPREDSLHGGERYLCAYIVSSNGKPADDLKGYLGERLPEYMIPAHVIEIEAIPFTPTGKIDRNAFPAPEIVVEGYTAPRNETEKTLAGIWEAVLGRDQVGINDNFFNVGGDSIKSIQIMSRLNNTGYKIQLKDIFQFPTIAELSPHVKKSQRIADQSPVTGPVQLTPIQQSFFRAAPADPHHYNQAVMLYSAEGFDKEIIGKVFAKLQEHHDALRMTYNKDVETGGVRQINQHTGLPISLQEYDADVELEDKINEIQASIDLEKGPLMKLGLFHREDGDRLLMVVHHLVIDGISWRILFEDIETLVGQISTGREPQLPLKTDSFKLWAEILLEYANHKSLLKERDYWSHLESEPAPLIPQDMDSEENLVKNTGNISFDLEEAETGLLLNNVNRWFNTEINDILMTALGLAVRDSFGFDRVAVVLEGHGREELHKEMDISRTVGWFTTEYPVVLDMSYAEDSGRQIKEIKETLRKVPNKGIGYGVLKYLANDSMELNLKPQIVFNYLGQFDADVKEAANFEMAGESTGNSQSSRNSRPYQLEFNGMIAGNRLSMTLSYNRTQFKEETMNALSGQFHSRLQKLIAFCSSRDTGERTPSDFTFKELTIHRLQQLMDQFPDIEDIYPLSPMQEGMLFHALVDEDSASYFEQTAFRLQGELDIEVVKKSMDQLFGRHDILRTAFIHRDVPRPLQLVLKNRSVDFYYEDIGHIASSEEQEDFCREFKAADKQRFFDLSGEILGRVSILRLNPSTYEFIWSFHHILMDGWCIGILNSEFFDIYNSSLKGKAARLPVPKPYRTYIQWLEKQDREESRRYWQTYLDDFEEQTGIPKTSRNQGTYRNEEVSFQLTADETHRLNNLAARHHVTLNIVAQSIWAFLLGKYNGKEDVVFGSVVSGRPFELEGVESMLGLFINTIPVRIRFDEGMSFHQLLQNVQQDYLAGEAYHYHPLGDIQSHSPLKQNLLDHLFVFENYPVAEQIEGYGNQNKTDDTDLPSFKLTGVHRFEQTNYDFSIMMAGSERLSVIFKYNANAVDSDFVNRVAGHFRLMLDQVMDTEDVVISAFTLLSEEEKHRLLVEFNDTAADYPTGKTLHRLFEEKSEIFRDRCSVISGQCHITYGELDQRANRLAHVLREKGVGPDTIVAVMIERSVEMIIGLFGILKAGGAYLPIATDYPQDRIDYMLKDSNTKLLLTSDDLAGAMNCAPTTPTQQLTHSPTQLCYIIYTSGSTGKPKGVMIQHRAIHNRLNWMQKAYSISPQDVIMQKTPYTFDVSVWELFWWSLQGAAVCLPGPGEEKDPAAIVSIIASRGVTTIHFVPSMLNAFLEYLAGAGDINGLGCLRQVFSSGEELTPYQAGRFYTLLGKFTGSRLINLYGPTEAAVDVSYFDCPASEAPGKIPIGKPIDNIHLYVVDKQLQLQPVGIAGELMISGDGLARGYLNRPELTAKKFVDLNRSSRSYKTGDLARWLPDGNIEFLGRIDFQVKIRGFRIELGEIENHLLKHEGIKEVVVIDKNEGERKYLCAYFTAHGTEPSEIIETSLLKDYLEAALPDYMVPACFVHRDRIPLNASGKVHRSKLPDPQDTDFHGSGSYEAPVTKTQRAIAGVWKEVLGREKIGIMNNFFDLGGNSLDLVSVSNKLRAALKQDIPMVALLNYPTISQLENYLSNAKLPGAEIDVPVNFVLLNSSPDARGNIFFIHEILGDVGAYMLFSQQLGAPYNCWGVNAGKLKNYVPRNESIEEISAKYISQMRQIQPRGPYLLATWSWGGHLGLEMALQLERMGEKLDLLAFFDTLGPDCAKETPLPQFTLETEKEFLSQFFVSTGNQAELETINDIQQLWIRAVEIVCGSPALVAHLRQLLIENALALPGYDDLTGEELIQYMNLNRTHLHASSRYIPSGKLDTRVDYFWANQNDTRVESWGDYCQNPVIYHEVNGDHHSIFRDKEQIAGFAEIFKKTLEQLKCADSP